MKNHFLPGLFVVFILQQRWVPNRFQLIAVPISNGLELEKIRTHADDLISAICLAVKNGCDATDIGKTIHLNLSGWRQAFGGVRTDLSAVKKK